MPKTKSRKPPRTKSPPDNPFASQIIHPDEDEDQDEGEPRGAPPRLHKEEHGGPRVPKEDISKMQRRSTRGSGAMTNAEIHKGYRSLGKPNLFGDD